MVQKAAALPMKYGGTVETHAILGILMRLMMAPPSVMIENTQAMKKS
jgi:hypothetical protein